MNYQTRKDAADAVVKEIAAAGGHAVAFGADVSDETAVTSLFKAVTGQLGDVGILVNNAGIAHQRTVDSVQLADFDEAIRVNLGRHGSSPTPPSPQCAAPIGPHHLHVLGRRQHRRHHRPHYAASKAGMLGIMHGYAFAAGQGGHHLERDLTCG